MIMVSGLGLALGFRVSRVRIMAMLAWLATCIASVMNKSYDDMP